MLSTRTLRNLAGTTLALGALAASAKPPGLATVDSAASTPLAVASIAQSDSDDWAQQQRELALLKTQAEIAKYRAEIARYHSEEATVQSPGAASLGIPTSGPVPPPVGAINVNTLPTPALATRHPSVIRIGGANGQYEARLELNGHTVDVRAGDALDDGWKVVSVDATSVRLTHGKQSVLLRL